MLLAGLGRFDEAIEALQMNERRAEHYLAWAVPFFREVGGRIGYVSGSLFHLWHGDFPSRRSHERHHLFHAFDFDPDDDVRLSESGCWRWNSRKTEMHDFLASYFRHRDSPGRPAG